MNTNKTSIVRITGNTYPASKLLRTVGFVFDADTKTWIGDGAALDELRRVSTATYSRANLKAVSGLTILEQ
jgi:hypothetical protein